MTRLAIVENGKQPNDNWHADMFIQLPANTPFGNMTLKYAKIVGRIDEVNRKIIETNDLWNEIMQQRNYGLVDRQVFAIESMVFNMRRALDELISMIYFLQTWKETGSYPTRIIIDSIGALVSEQPSNLMPLFGSDLEFLELLNSISNAYKHSFINSDLTRIGEEEPCIYALELKRNRLDSDPVWHNVRCREIVAKFDAFFNKSKNWLKEFASTH